MSSASEVRVSKVWSRLRFLTKAETFLTGSRAPECAAACTWRLGRSMNIAKSWLGSPVAGDLKTI